MAGRVGNPERLQAASSSTAAVSSSPSVLQFDEKPFQKNEEGSKAVGIREAERLAAASYSTATAAARRVASEKP